MKKISVFLLFLISVSGWGQSFDSIVDFSIELSSLSNPAVAEKAADNGRVVILEGLMANTEETVSGDEEGVIVILIGGEWIGTSDVRSYSCRVFFSGNQWDGNIPAGSRLLIAARVTGFDDESSIPEARMVSYRVLR